MSQFLCAQRADSPVARGASGAQCAWRAPRRRARRRGGGLRRALTKEASTAPSTTGARAAFFWTSLRETKRKFFYAARRRPRPPNFNVRAPGRGSDFSPTGPQTALRAPLNIEIGGARGREKLAFSFAGGCRARVEHIWCEWSSWGEWRAASADALGRRASSRSSSQSSSSPAPARAQSARDRRSRAPGGVWERLGGAGSAGGRSGLRRGSSEARIPCVFTVPK